MGQSATHILTSPEKDTAEDSSNLHAAKKHALLLDDIQTPSDLKPLSDSDLKIVANELRQETIDAVSKTGGHLGAGLGVVELTVALHAIFDTPKDKLIWDVGHQCYPHKILTGRREHIHTLRQGGGLSGFTKRSESKYDPFGAAHSSTSVSAGLGMSVAKDLQGHSNHIISVIGDGAMSAGMAYEAMNNAGTMKSKMIVILNDNNMSIAPPVGAMSRYLTKLVSSRSYFGARDIAKKVAAMLPPPLKKAAAKAEETARVSIGGGTFFEEMGFYYIGPIDGHNLDHLLPVLRNVKEGFENGQINGPVLIHAITKKGKGYTPAETSKDKMHGVATFDIVTGSQHKPKSSYPTYTKVFSNALIEEARKDPKIVAITAAMPDGTGLDAFGYEFPEKFFDVGIAEQHAVTFAAGLAAEGMKPFTAIYSTFLQRAYDQIVHDVAIQNLPVRFALDRAGLVGADGCTHAGAFDTAYMGCLPNMVLMAASNEQELTSMVATAAAYDEGPIAFRYPRGEATGIELTSQIPLLEIGKGYIVQEGTDAAILCYGTRLQECIKAAQDLQEKENISVTIADARFAKPLDTDLIKSLAKNHKALITIEEGSIGGFGSYVLQELNTQNLFDTCRIHTMHLPDYFQDHDKPAKQYEEANLNAQHICDTIKRLVCS